MSTLPTREILSRMMIAPGVDIGDMTSEIALRTVTYMTPEIALRSVTSPGHDDQIHITACVTGWGPTLHKTLMTWQVETTGLDADLIAHAFDELSAMQMRRAETARRLDFGRIAPRDAALLTHVRTDRLLTLVKPQTIMSVENAIRRLETLDIRGDRTWFKRDNVMLMEGTPDDDRPRVLMTTSMPWGNYDGAKLDIMAQGVPETVVAAMPGRLVREVMAVGDRLAPEMRPVLDREILSAHTNGAVLSLVTEPDWVPLAPLPRR